MREPRMSSAFCARCTFVTGGVAMDLRPPRAPPPCVLLSGFLEELPCHRRRLRPRERSCGQPRPSAEDGALEDVAALSTPRALADNVMQVQASRSASFLPPATTIGTGACATTSSKSSQSYLTIWQPISEMIRVASLKKRPVRSMSPTNSANAKE